MPSDIDDYKRIYALLQRAVKLLGFCTCPACNFTFATSKEGCTYEDHVEYRKLKEEVK